MTPDDHFRREWLLLAFGTVLAGSLGGYQRHLAHDETRAVEEARLMAQARTVADDMQLQLRGVAGMLAPLPPGKVQESASCDASVRAPSGGCCS